MNTNNIQPHTSSLKDDVLSHIESEHIEPKPKYTFLLHEGLFWSLFTASLFVGAAATAGIIFAETHVGWEFYELMHDNALTFAVETLPFVWVGALILMMVLGYYNLRETKRGYRYPLWVIIPGSVVISIAGGVWLHQAGFGYVVDHSIGQHIPLHRPALEQQFEFWQMPEEGRLIGVVGVAGSTTVVVDPEGDAWELDTSLLSPRHRLTLTEGSEVRLLGFGTSTENVFVVCVSLPSLGSKPVYPGHLMEQRRLFVGGMEGPGEQGERNFQGARSNECESVRTRIPLQSQ